MAEQKPSADSGEENSALPANISFFSDVHSPTGAGSIHHSLLDGSEAASQEGFKSTFNSESGSVGEIERKFRGLDYSDSEVFTKATLTIPGVPCRRHLLLNNIEKMSTPMETSSQINQGS